MITNIKQYEEAMNFDVDPENMSIEDIANMMERINMVYMDVMINCLDIKDRCRIMNSLTGVIFTIANIQMNMIVQAQGQGAGFEGYAPFNMDERTKEDYN